jgi:hypothetical protein
MTAEQYQRVKELFYLAIERAPGERAVFLEQACAGDPVLRVEVERLLACDRQESRFMETPACIAEDAMRLSAGACRLVRSPVIPRQRRHGGGLPSEGHEATMVLQRSALTGLILG